MYLGCGWYADGRLVGSILHRDGTCKVIRLLSVELTVESKSRAQNQVQQNNFSLFRFGINTERLLTISSQSTFHWSGEYIHPFVDLQIHHQPSTLNQFPSLTMLNVRARVRK